MKSREITQTIILAGFLLLFFGWFLMILWQSIYEFSLLPPLLSRVIPGAGF